MTITVTAYTDLRSPCPFVAKAEVYRWEEDFGVVADWWPCTTPLEEAFGPAEGRDERQLRKIRYTYVDVPAGTKACACCPGAKRCMPTPPATAHGAASP